MPVVAPLLPPHFPPIVTVHPAALRRAISDCILIFVRAPELGRVKTRLAAEIGERAALRVYRRLAEHAVAEARAVGDVALRIHFTPADASVAVRAWLGDEGATYLPQSDADLGGRMRAAFDAAFTERHHRVVIIGSDLPTLTTELLRAAFAGLHHHPVVIGPANDGGYYLLGLREMIPELFHDIPWSTGQVFEQTMARLRALGITPARLPALGDVDVAADLPDGWGEWAMEESGVTA